MFGSLKKKLASLTEKLTKKVEEEPKPEEKTRPETPEQKPQEEKVPEKKEVEVPEKEIAKKSISLKERLFALRKKATGQPEAEEPREKEAPAEIEKVPEPEQVEEKPEAVEREQAEEKPEAVEREGTEKPGPEEEVKEKTGEKPEIEGRPEEQEAREEPPEIQEEQKEEKQGLIGKLLGRKKEEGPSLGGRLLGAITETEISPKALEETMEDFQMLLLENDVALDAAEKMCEDIKEELTGKRVKRSQIEEAIKEAIKKSLEDVLSKGGESIDLIEEVKKAEKPYKIVFVGINGTGKTTSIAKIANLLKEQGLEPVVAASDTFRAASIEQIEHHTNKLGIKLIKHKYGADAAAVAFDAVEHAKAKNKPVVLIDTAGRMQTNTNLMDELKKILRVIQPNLVIFVGDSLTGNDAIEQAKIFNKARIDAVILTKADADAKGGACLSIAYEIQKPILYLGTGQNYPDLVKFTPEWFIEKATG